MAAKKNWKKCVNCQERDGEHFEITFRVESPHGEHYNTIDVRACEPCSKAFAKEVEGAVTTVLNKWKSMKVAESA